MALVKLPTPQPATQAKPQAKPEKPQEKDLSPQQQATQATQAKPPRPATPLANLLAEADTDTPESEALTKLEQSLAKLEALVAIEQPDLASLRAGFDTVASLLVAHPNLADTLMLPAKLGMLSSAARALVGVAATEGAQRTTKRTDKKALREAMDIPIEL